MNIYINNGTSLVANSTWYENIVDFWDSAVAFGDIDNDGDLDLVASGTEGEGQTAQSKIYINNGSSFIESVIWGSDLVGVTYSSLAFGDYDNDGHLDLGIMGLVDSLYMYRNDGATLIKNSTNIFSIYDGAFAWGDYDNDGDIDIVGTGREYYTRVYNNNETTFIRDIIGADNLTYVASGSLAWSDIDNDNDLDLILTGTGKTGPTISKVYTNNISITSPNTPPNPPNPPANNYSYNNRKITLIWGNGSDAQTPVNGLYYNMRIGTVASKNLIVSGMYGGSSNPTAGYFGNMMQRKNITLKADRFQPSTAYYWSVQTIDTGLAKGDWSAEQSFVTPADMEKPDVAVDSPGNGQALWNFTAAFNVTVSDNLNVSNVSLWGNWSGGWHLNETNSSGCNGCDYVFTKDLGGSGDGDGMYVWEVVACDNETNCGSTGNYSLTVDTTKPVAELVGPTPANNTNLSATGVTINISHSEANPDTLTINWNGTNTSYSYSGDCTEIVKSGLVDGTYTYYAWVNDTAGWKNQTETRTLTIDTVPISAVSLVWPTPDNGSSQGYNYTYINVSLSEVPDACLLEWNDGVKSNMTMSRSGANCYRNMSGLISYVYSYEVFANDSADNWNSSEWRTVIVDMGEPIVILASPQQDSWDSDGDITFVYNASDSNLDSCSLWGEWSGGWHLNETNSSPNNGSYSSFAKTLADGYYSWNVRCNDTASNYGYSPSNLTINIDTTEPVVVIAQPDNKTYNSSPALDFSYDESNPDSCWYDLNSAGNNTLPSCDTNGTVMASSEGSNNVTLYMNDSAGNLNSSNACWTLDTTPPEITIDSPANRSYNSLWVWANVTLDEDGSWCGYSLDGSGNVSMGNDSMTHFYHNVSGGLDEAQHDITFSCNDTVGYMNTTAKLYFTVDRTAPGISDVVNGTAYWNGININWTTDEPCNSSVLYGTNATDLSSSETNTTFAAAHKITLTGLAGSTTYYYNVSSCDPAGNCNMSGTFNFTTAACVPSWSCPSWGSCQPGGTQSCSQWVDANGCGFSHTGSNTRSCTYSSGSSWSSTPAKANFTFVRINAGVPVTKEIAEGLTVTIKVRETLVDVNLRFSTLAGRPSGIEESFKGKVYQYIEMNSSGIGDDDIEEASLEFRVSDDWIIRNDIDKETVTLYRYHDNGWQALGTDYLSTDNGFHHYRAMLTGFSYFVIAGQENIGTGAAGNATRPSSLCNPYSRRCSGDDVQECDSAGTGWALKESCAYGCDSATVACRPPPTGDTAWLYIAVPVMVAAFAASLYMLKMHRKGHETPGQA